MTLISAYPIPVEPVAILATMSSALSAGTAYDLVEDKTLRSSTITGFTATFTTGVTNLEAKNDYYMANYIDSLTDTQLVEMEKKLAAKEDEFLVYLDTQINGDQETFDHSRTR